MKCERCGNELSDIDLYCQRCGKAVFPDYMDEEDVWAYYKSDEELQEILKAEEEQKAKGQEERKDSEESPVGTPKQEFPLEEKTAENREDIQNPDEQPEHEKKPRMFFGRKKKKEMPKEPVPEEEEKILDEEADLEGLDPDDIDDAEIETDREEDKEDKEENKQENIGEEAAASQDDAESGEDEIPWEDSVFQEEEPDSQEEEPASVEEEFPKDDVEELFLQERPAEEEEFPEEAGILEVLEEQPGEIKEDSQDEDIWDDTDMEDHEEEDASEEDESEEEVPLSPERKKAKRCMAALAAVFLVVCLGTGIVLGLRQMKEIERKEQQYYNKNKEQAVTAGTQSSENSSKEDSSDEKEEQDKQQQEENKEEEKSQEEGQEEEKPGEEKKQEYFKLVNAEEIDFSKYKKIQPTGVEENSVKASEGYDYSAKSAIDGDVSSSWQEGEEGLGEGKGIKLNLDGNHKVRYLVLYLGNWRSDQLWKYNARPHELTIQVGDNQKKDVEFSDEKKKFCLSFDEPVDAAYVSLYIKSAYKGQRWQDNCISEVEIYE